MRMRVKLISYRSSDVEYECDDVEVTIGNEKFSLLELLAKIAIKSQEGLKE